MDGLASWISVFNATLKRSKASATSETGTDYPSEAHELTPVYSGVRVRRPLFVFSPFFFWSLFRVSFELQPLNTPLVYSNVSFSNIPRYAALLNRIG